MSGVGGEQPVAAAAGMCGGQLAARLPFSRLQAFEYGRCPATDRLMHTLFARLPHGIPCCRLSQGNIDPDRRNYAAAFKAAMHPAVLSQLRRRGEQLLLVGAEVRACMHGSAQLAHV